MAASADRYVDPVAARYASAAMQELFSPRNRALVWRDLWIALAEAEHEIGLPVSADQVSELRAHRDEIDFARVAELEAELRHDVMAHIHHYGELAPGARGILHLGATSCYVTDNADVILMRRALELTEARLLRAIHGLAGFARVEAARPTLGLTHLQPAQLTTIGKRAALWIQDLVESYDSLVQIRGRLGLRGVKGTTGTQASFWQLCGRDSSRVDDLERRVAEKMGFEKVVALTGQTYSRLWDFRALAPLSEVAIALQKFSNDLRLLQSWGEMEEPFQKTQIGSSAMPYKRNPMRSERLGSLSKLALAILPGVGTMAATQWFERTLDDSAMRRAAIPQSFLITDAMLLIARNLSEGLIVHPAVAERRVAEQLPFIAAEELLMEAASGGGDRQDLHERLRQHSWKAAERVRDHGESNPLRGYLEEDPQFGPILAQLPPWDPTRFTGLAEVQTLRYLDEVVDRLPRPTEDDLTELTV